MLISGFPGVGKTRASQTFKAMVDLDNIQYMNREKYPYCYIYDAVQLSKQGYIVLMSQELEIVELISLSGEEYMIVCPDISLKNEYMIRYLKRGNINSWIDAVMKNWETHLNELKTYPKENIVVLQSGQYLSDVMMSIRRNHK